MTKAGYAKMSTDELVEQFLHVALQQGEAMRLWKSGTYNVWFRKMLPVEDEFKRRNERSALAALYNHSDPQVRYQAAAATLAVFPEQARTVLQIISDRDEWPSQLEARGMLGALDDGSFVPS